MFRSIRSFALALALLGSAGPASGNAAEAGRGPTSPRLGVWLLSDPALPAAEQRQVQDALLTEALPHSGDGLGWLLVAFDRLPAARPQQAVLAELDRLLAEGRKDYRYLKLDQAASAFERAAALLRGQPLTRCDAGRLADMYLYWARAVLDGGDEIGAQALLGQIQRFDDKAMPDPAVMPPNLVAAYDLALDDRRSRAHGKVLIEAGPAAASVFVDCQRLSSGVVELTGVAGDEFWLAAEVEGGTFAQRFFMPEGQRRRLIVYSGRPGDPARLAEHTLALSRRPPALAALAGRADGELDATAELVGVELLLVAELDQAASGRLVRLGLYVPGHGLSGAPIEVPLTRTGRPDPDSLGRAIAELAGRARSPALLALLAPPPEPPVPARAAAAAAAPTGAAPETEARSEGTAFWKTWWFWTAAGVVVAGAAATGLALGLSEGPTEPSGRVVLTISPP